MDLGGGEGKVPVAAQRFGRGQRGVAVVGGGEGEGEVAPEDEGREPDCVWRERCPNAVCIAGGVRYLPGKSPV